MKHRESLWYYLLSFQCPSYLSVSLFHEKKKLQKYATFGVEFKMSQHHHVGMHHGAVC